MKLAIILLVAALAGCSSFRVGSYCAYGQNCNITVPAPVVAAKGA